MTFLTTKVTISPSLKTEFIDWQMQFHAVIAKFKGFISLEMASTKFDFSQTWTLVQRFSSHETLQIWKDSQERQKLIEDLTKMIAKSPDASIKDGEINDSKSEDNATEIFVTDVSPGKEDAYCEWISKIHSEEAKFPGFQRVFVQSPREGQGHHWITLLQFDTGANLDRWLASPQRKEIFKDSAPLIASIENYRMISSYGGWFSSISKKGEMPSPWKQSMIVLLVLFPIVMLERIFLNPLLIKVNPSLATFIGNFISVALLAWPFVPLAISFLRWWLSPRESQRKWANILGTSFVVLLYVIEIALFWKAF